MSSKQQTSSDHSAPLQPQPAQQLVVESSHSCMQNSVDQMEARCPQSVEESVSSEAEDDQRAIRLVRFRI